MFKKNIKIQIDRYVISYVGQSSIIGIDDVRTPEDPDQFSTYSYKVQCITKEAEVMFLYKKDFMALKNQTNVWNYMLKMQEKNQASVNRHIAKTN